MKHYNQTQILQIFKNLIKANHDGIVITQDDELIFYNKQIKSLVRAIDSKNGMITANNPQPLLIPAQVEEKQSLKINIL